MHSGIIRLRKRTGQAPILAGLSYLTPILAVRNNAILSIIFQLSLNYL